MKYWLLFNIVCFVAVMIDVFCRLCYYFVKDIEKK